MTRPRHPVTGRWLAFDCEVDCLNHCAGLCGDVPDPICTCEPMLGARGWSAICPVHPTPPTEE